MCLSVCEWLSLTYRKQEFNFGVGQGIKEILLFIILYYICHFLLAAAINRQQTSQSYLPNADGWQTSCIPLRRAAARRKERTAAALMSVAQLFVAATIKSFNCLFFYDSQLFSHSAEEKDIKPSSMLDSN